MLTGDMRKVRMGAEILFFHRSWQNEIWNTRNEIFAIINPEQWEYLGHIK